jgi:hypothetical protein
MKKVISLILILSTLFSLTSMSVISASAKSVDKEEKLFEFSWIDEKHSNKYDTNKKIIVSLETRKCILGYQSRLKISHEIVCVPYDWVENEERFDDKKDHYTGYYWSYKKPLTIEEICKKDSYLRNNNVLEKLKIIYQCQKVLNSEFNDWTSMQEVLKSEIVDNSQKEIIHSIFNSIKSTILSKLGLDATDAVIDRGNTAGAIAADDKSPSSFTMNFFTNLGIQIDTMTVAMEKALEEIDGIQGNTSAQYQALLLLTENDLYDIILNMPKP